MLTSMVIQHNKSKMRNAPIKQLGFFKCVLNPKKTTTYVHVRMPNMCLLTFSFHMVMDRPRVQRVASLGRCYVTYFDPWPLTQRSPNIPPSQWKNVLCVCFDESSRCERTPNHPHPATSPSRNTTFRHTETLDMSMLPVQLNMWAAS